MNDLTESEVFSNSDLFVKKSIGVAKGLKPIGSSIRFDSSVRSILKFVLHQYDHHKNELYYI